jgi:hypothetical protein
LPRRNTQNPRRNGRNLRIRLREVEPHIGSHMLSREGNKLINEKIMMMPTPFLVLEVEAEEEEESSHVLHVGRMDISHSSVQRRRKTSVL